MTEQFKLITYVITTMMKEPKMVFKNDKFYVPIRYFTDDVVIY